MTDLSFIRIQKQIIDLTFEGSFNRILTLINEVEQDYPNHWNQLYFWKVSVLATLGDYAQALITLEAAIEKGCWWDPKQLLEATDLYPLHPYQEFHSIVKTCRRRCLRKASIL